MAAYDGKHDAFAVLAGKQVVFGNYHYTTVIHIWFLAECSWGLGTKDAVFPVHYCQLICHQNTDVSGSPGNLWRDYTGFIKWVHKLVGKVIWDHIRNLKSGRKVMDECMWSSNWIVALYMYEQSIAAPHRLLDALYSVVHCIFVYAFVCVFVCMHLSCFHLPSFQEANVL